MYVIKNHSLFLKSIVLQVGRDDIIKHGEAREKYGIICYRSLIVI